MSADIFLEDLPHGTKQDGGNAGDQLVRFNNVCRKKSEIVSHRKTKVFHAGFYNKCPLIEKILPKKWCLIIRTFLFARQNVHGMKIYTIMQDMEKT
ncbi:hypothetical protein [Acetobacter sp.]|uniref:hypothetical protein n=1 Tax=Acetobacter sp. TaxID=440 RepID=UPI0039E7757C